VKLFFSPMSPYARKVRVVALETGLADRITGVETNVWGAINEVAVANPVGKIPALQLDDGSVLADSPLICAFLDSLHDGEPLIPADPARRWATLQRQVWADGLMEAIRVRSVELTRRPPDKQWDAWVSRQEAAIDRLLPVLEADADAIAAALDIGSIATACALAYADFRFPERDWRRDCPALAAWHGAFADRASMTATAIPA